MVIVGDRPAAKRVWELFAELLEYPRESPVGAVRECRALTGTVPSNAEAKLAEFQSFAEGASLGRLQEEYTRAFDMDESHSLDVGFHLLGETYKRSALLLEFKERYRAHGIDVAGELADHLPVVLRLLAASDDPELTDEIVGEAVRPMLEMMERKDEDPVEGEEDEGFRPPAASLPYHGLLTALLLVVREVPTGDRPSPAQDGGAVTHSPT